MNQAASLPRDTNMALRMVMGAMSSLQDVYMEETEALVAIDTPKFLSLQEKKIDVARTYQAHVSEMMVRREELKAADPALKAKLKEMQEKFHVFAEHNLEALARMQRCTDKLAETIRNAAVRSARDQRTFSYGETGAISNSAKNKVISSGLSETA